MLKVLFVVVAVLALAVVLGLLSNRRASSEPHLSSSEGRDARAAKAKADQAVIARQGGQGAGQGGVGGGMGF